jgi:DNA repair protein RecN (Recombination protein N)
MLTSISIHNYALIEQLDIDFGAGFSVITGETGAGKSILLGAIGLLLGQRADSKVIKPGASRCVIEAQFDISNYGLETFFSENDFDFDGTTCSIRRELTTTGKSRSFINDTPAQLAQLKTLGEHLIDIHSQHQNLLLNTEDFQLNTLDILAEDKSLLSSFKNAFTQYGTKKKEFEQATEEAKNSKADEEYLRAQQQQISDAQLSVDEQEELENELDILSHAEEIKASLYKLQCSLQGSDDSENTDLLSELKNDTNELKALSTIFSEVTELSERMSNCFVELKDIGEELGRLEEHIDFNPSHLDQVNERLNIIYSLEKKFNVRTIQELLDIKQELDDKLSKIDNSDEHLKMLEQEVAQLKEQALKEAEHISNLRSKAALLAEKEMEKRLIPLGIPNVQFKVNLTRRSQMDESGIDKVDFLFCANKKGLLQSISQVASGGEISRVMLALKAIIAKAAMMPTVIFDEIDTGVSGSIAEKMADIMEEMGSSGRQVISITHLPQIAAKGSRHYRVYKEDNNDGTSSHIEELSAEERINEIAHMLSGASITEAAINNARALLHMPNN